MSIFSSIGNAIKSAATGVYNTLNPIVTSVKNAITGGSTQTASALQGTYIPNSIKTTTTAPKVTGSYNGVTYYNGYVPNGLTAGQISSGQMDEGNNMSNISLPVKINAGQQATTSSGSSLNLSKYAGTGTTTVSTKSLNGNIGTANNTSGGTASVTQPLVLGNTPTSIATPKVDTTKIAGNVAGIYTRNADGTYTPVPDIQNQTDQQITDREKQLYDSVLGPRQDVNQDPEVIAARQRRNQIQQSLLAPVSELNAIVAKQNQDLLQLRQTGSQEGVTEAVYGGQQNAINYNAAIRALPLQAQISSLQGDLKNAEDNLNELTRIKTEQINNQYEYNKNLYLAIESRIDKKDSRIYEEKKTANDRAYQEQKDLIKTQASLLQTAVAQKAPQSVINAINNAKDIKSAISAAGQYGTDMLDTQYKQAQINKLNEEISANKPVTGEYANIINGAAGLVANTKKQQVKTNISNALVNKDYRTAYAEIANSVSDGLTGTPKTKFDDARTDINILSGMKKAIKDYADAGGDMGLLKGTEEQIKRKLGIDSGKASALATQLWREFQTYRSNMTGAAFTPQESRDYASVNPTLGKSLDLNISVIDGAISQLSNRVTSTINSRIPDAQKIYNLINDNSNTTSNNIDYTSTLDNIFK